MWKKMGDMGLLGITAPEEYGGQGISTQTSGFISQ
jgi:isovaleryl-CoA dehydrogenase